MNALAVAMKMEQDGEAFYRDLAEKAALPGFREIFRQLADDELSHYLLFQKMQQMQPRVVPEETTVLKKAGNLFKAIIAAKRFTDLDTSQLELYQDAMEMERKSQEFYLENSDNAGDLSEKELWRKLAREEEKHYVLLHNVYELVLRPQVWVENGEFVHLEEY
jgi:rubrerythrin